MDLMIAEGASPFNLIWLTVWSLSAMMGVFTCDGEVLKV